MSHLWVRLTLGFALVSLVSTLTVAGLARWAVDTSFRGYLAQSQATESGIIERLGVFYATRNSWDGVGPLLTPGRGMQGRGQGAMMGGGLIIADPTGWVVADPTELRIGTRLTARERAAAIPLTVDGRVVGLLLVHSSQGGALSAAATSFLNTLNLALGTAGLLAGALGLVLGLVMARSLAAPLDQLAAGARRIAQGQRGEPVVVRGPREIETVALAFNEMQEALEAGEIQRRHMVADIAHELRTPLTVVQGNLRALLDDVYPLSKTEVATIYEASLGLRRLVEDLRELSLAEAGRLELRLQAVDLVPLLEREVALFAEQAAAHEVALLIEVDGTLPLLQADPERLAQIVRNLVSNALRYTPAGGTITLQASHETQAHPSVAVVRLAVVDTGSGIAPEDLPHIFERFYRADRGRARAAGGSGLGLAITQQLVLLHHGTLGATSELGRGTRIWLTLPVA